MSDPRDPQPSSPYTSAPLADVLRAAFGAPNNAETDAAWLELTGPRSVPFRRTLAAAGVIDTLDQDLIVNELWVRLWQAWRQHKVQHEILIDHAQGWLFKTLRHVRLEHYRYGVLPIKVPAANQPTVDAPRQKVVNEETFSDLVQSRNEGEDEDEALEAQLYEQHDLENRDGFDGQLSLFREADGLNLVEDDEDDNTRRTNGAFAPNDEKDADDVDNADDEETPTQSFLRQHHDYLVAFLAFIKPKIRRREYQVLEICLGLIDGGQPIHYTHIAALMGLSPKNGRRYVATLMCRLTAALNEWRSRFPSSRDGGEDADTLDDSQ